MTIPTTSKALVVAEVGKPLSLITDHPVPKPGPDQVLLKVTVAGINPHDQKTRDDGLFTADGLPALVTNDVTGTVVALGPGVTKYQIGDRVLSHPGFSTAYSQNGSQEYAVNDIGAGFQIPDSITDDEAATLPTNIIAPLVGLFDDKNGVGIPAPWTDAAKSFDYKGTVLLILGGGSNCGKFAVQLAKLAGIGTIITVGGPEQELKSYGATHVLDRHGGYEAVLERVRKVVGDDLIYAFDAINVPADQILGLNALSSSKKGKVARLLPLGPVDETKVVGKKAGFELIDVFGSSQARPALAYPFWEHVPAYLTSGKIKPLSFTVKQGLTAENANSVLDAYRDGKRVQKTHIHV
ncbi:putative alcohol dehydrogenase [Mytilinidion resinicola]|uniref:Alcohol dehydrogenase n=1 Tax=Mytilinidion resinicola TaxID=574789 RepID=A0A6A6Y872_9PEZI|nr:putative alcohol dehydrogenase [Mytilinidion resinicola]KAF2805036.1 putative alcohol dehydrogenase [Mytilinidion resinicola]